MEFDLLEFSREFRDVRADFGERAVVFFLERELKKRLGVVEGSFEFDEFVNLGLKARLFLRQRAGSTVVVPKAVLG